ncbi:MAG: Rpn family recombination-promoting nuclease/putative transposase [Lachnospiraceae bacterium]|nr:Rpn family recombination-promoting nuclease/putative transposase [Lachnospiraceae bacterium]
MANHTSNISASHYDLSILDSATGKVPYSLTNDYLFRAVMQDNQNVLRGLVCSLLHLKADEINSIDIRNPIILGEQIDSKTFILDLKILLNDNELINIEMQITNYLDWPDRSIGYLSREFDQLNRGSVYANVLLVHQIGILNFTLFPECPEFYATNKIMNVKNHHIYSDKFTLSVLDLTQIHIATEEDISHQLDYWAKLFLAKTWEDIKMLADKNDAIKEAAATMYVMSADEKIRMQCEARERYEYEQKAAIGYGEQRLANLINCLIADNCQNKISKVTTDKIYREKLYKEYQL